MIKKIFVWLLFFKRVIKEIEKRIMSCCFFKDDVLLYLFHNWYLYNLVCINSCIQYHLLDRALHLNMDLDSMSRYYY